VTVVPAGTLDTYERLRAAVLCAEPGCAPNLGTLRREGLAAWMKGLVPAPAGATPVPGTARRTPISRDPAPIPSELTRLIASIVLTVAGEPAHV
jgi:hypothetical protein